MGRKSRIKKERREHREQTKIKIISSYYRNNPANFIEDYFDMEMKPFYKFFINKFAKWGFKRG